jgi:hypothetical protein
MTDPTGSSAVELVTQTQSELAEMAEVIRSQRFLERLRTRDVPEARLRALAGEQHAIVSSDRRSFAQLAARFPAGMAGAFFLGMAEGEGVALDKLRGLCDWLGMTEAELRGYEPHPGAQAYPAFVAWLALNGSRADVVLAFLANLAIWGENCAKVAADQPEVGRYVVQRRRGIAPGPGEVHRARDLPVHRLGQLDIPPRVTDVSLAQCRMTRMRKDLVHAAPEHHVAAEEQAHHAFHCAPVAGNEPRPLARRRCVTNDWFPWPAGRCTIAIPRRGDADEGCCRRSAGHPVPASRRTGAHGRDRRGARQGWGPSLRGQVGRRNRHRRDHSRTRRARGTPHWQHLECVETQA